MTGFRPSLSSATSQTTLVGAVCLSLGALLIPVIRQRWKTTGHVISSPKSTVLSQLSAEDVSSLPYPPDILPGGRDVLTPYGSIRVFEWGPEQGEQVLLVHGISTPLVSLGNLAEELVARGHRVMLFGKPSLFPTDVSHGSETQSKLCRSLWPRILGRSKRLAI
jgi:hypothetical protein